MKYLENANNAKIQALAPGQKGLSLIGFALLSSRPGMTATVITDERPGPPAPIPGSQQVSSRSSGGIP
ncbi:MAG: hypothetical protein PHV33_09545 [Elusimicrobiales bacterium]|nr:hypothetical protein [Elusimicrobiales bacterium]